MLANFRYWLCYRMLTWHSQLLSSEWERTLFKRHLLAYLKDVRELDGAYSIAGESTLQVKL